MSFEDYPPYFLSETTYMLSGPGMSREEAAKIHTFDPANPPEVVRRFWERVKRNNARPPRRPLPPGLSWPPMPEPGAPPEVWQAYCMEKIRVAQECRRIREAEEKSAPEGAATPKTPPPWATEKPGPETTGG